jgi:hypothetical protein
MALPTSIKRQHVKKCFNAKHTTKKKKKKLWAITTDEEDFLPLLLSAMLESFMLIAIPMVTLMMFSIGTMAEHHHPSCETRFKVLMELEGIIFI